MAQMEEKEGEKVWEIRRWRENARFYRVRSGRQMLVFDLGAKEDDYDA